MQNSDIKNVYISKQNENISVLPDIDNINYTMFDTESQVKEYANAMRKATKVRNYNILSLRGLGKDKKADNVQSCASYILFKEKETKDGEFLQKIDKMYLCKDRYCMFCAGVKASKNLRILYKTFDRMGIDNSSIKYRFLTLTVPNVNINDLKRQIKSMMSAFNALNARYTKAGLWKGYYKSLEITYNEDTETYHPHIHIIADGEYIPQKILSQNWFKECTQHGIKNIPKTMENKGILSVNIQAVMKPWELCKYVIKPDTLTYKAVYELIDTEALKGIRDNATGGTIKETIKTIKTEMKNKKNEDKQLYSLARYIREIAYAWNGEEYVRK